MNTVVRGTACDGAKHTKTQLSRDSRPHPSQSFNAPHHSPETLKHLPHKMSTPREFISRHPHYHCFPVPHSRFDPLLPGRLPPLRQMSPGRKGISRLCNEMLSHRPDTGEVFRNLWNARLLEAAAEATARAAAADQPKSNVPRGGEWLCTIIHSFIH